MLRCGWLWVSPKEAVGAGVRVAASQLGVLLLTQDGTAEGEGGMNARVGRVLILFVVF